MSRLYILFIFISILCSSPNAFGAADPNTGTEVGRYAPSIELEDLAGTEVSLESLRGSVVLLSFWSANCPLCKAKMPSMNRLYDALHDRGFQVVSVAVDQNEQPVRDYVFRTNISFAVLLDKNKKVFLDGYEAPGLPATYLIDRNGIIVEKFNGLEVWDAPEMKNRVLMLLRRQ